GELQAVVKRAPKAELEWTASVLRRVLGVGERRPAAEECCPQIDPYPPQPAGSRLHMDEDRDRLTLRGDPPGLWRTDPQTWLLIGIPWTLGSGVCLAGYVWISFIGGWPVLEVLDSSVPYLIAGVILTWVGLKLLFYGLTAGLCATELSIDG